MQFERLNGRQKLDWVRLSRTSNVGPVTFAQLLTNYGNAGDADTLPGGLAARAV